MFRTLRTVLYGEMMKLLSGLDEPPWFGLYIILLIGCDYLATPTLPDFFRLTER